MTYEEFSADRKTAYAVVRCFEIIGEATKSIPENIRKMQSVIPWKAMAGMRDKCVHTYFGVRYKTVWTAVKEELPVYKPLIQSLLNELKKGMGEEKKQGR
jgi:uncharacterized protein with HEPN domain